MMKRMKVYVAARFKGTENKSEIDQLCTAVRASGIEDFCFIRDVENYQKTFDNPKDLWERSYDEVAGCDAFLIDVSDAPSGGRVIETGIAFAMKKPIFVIIKNGVDYKEIYDGVSTCVIRYDNYEDISASLAKYLD